MNGPVQFETPENVQISYQAAGPGTRFVAWFVDTILIFLLLVCIGILLACSGAALNVVFQDLADRLDPEADRDTSELPFYVFGMIWLLVGLGNLVYFGLSELILRGQTIGKRQVGIRVVKADGFALDAGSILVRSVFRVIDHFPLFWIVPLVSARGQRFGDMAAGTVVIADRPEELGGLREALAQRSAAESRFRFDATILKRARPEDVAAVEKILERRHSLVGEQVRILAQVTDALARRLQVGPPEEADRVRFLEDFLAAEYRRQYRKLG